MKKLIAAFALIGGSASVWAHGYRIGDLEILHPAITVPAPLADYSCAHVKIINHGTTPEHLLGAEVAAARHVRIVALSDGGKGLSYPASVAIAPGATLNLNRGNWCLFLSGITATLEADMGVVRGWLLFENQGKVPVEFMIDPAPY
jgi:periplasmic copper chaperone A